MLIDDNPVYASECAEAGMHVLLYDWQLAYPWSKTADGGCAAWCLHLTLACTALPVKLHNCDTATCKAMLRIWEESAVCTALSANAPTPTCFCASPTLFCASDAEAGSSCPHCVPLVFPAWALEQHFNAACRSRLLCKHVQATAPAHSARAGLGGSGGSCGSCVVQTAAVRSYPAVTCLQCGQYHTAQSAVYMQGLLCLRPR